MAHWCPPANASRSRGTSGNVCPGHASTNMEHAPAEHAAIQHSCCIIEFRRGCQLDVREARRRSTDHVSDQLQAHDCVSVVFDPLSESVIGTIVCNVGEQ